MRAKRESTLAAELTALGRFELFHGLPDDKLAEIAGRLRLVEVRKGNMLVQQGDEGNSFYVILAGRFAVSVAGQRGGLAILGVGDTVGEIAFFAGIKRTTTVTALRHSVVVEIDRLGFEAVKAAVPSIERQIIGSLASKLVDTTKRLHEKPKSAVLRTVALVGASGGAIRPPILAKLRSVFAVGPPGRFLTSDDVPDTLRRAPEGDPALLRWLEECEARSPFLLFVPDQTLTSWTRVCMAQSDEVLLIAEGDEAPPPGEVERYAFDVIPAQRRRLVRVHRQRTSTVARTQAWLYGRDVFMTHHVAYEEDEDWASLRRFLIGRAVGLVAGGGGAFGPAHVGIYRALRERGIVFDIFGGASVGSAMAAAFAMMLEPSAIIEGMRDIFVANRAFRRMTIPRYALLDHRAFDTGLQRHYGGVAIEDMWKPYFAIAADLSVSEPRVMQSGPLWEAIRASSAIPGVLPPFFSEDGHMLVDGGTVDNVPIEPMARMKAGPNVAIVLNPARKRLYDLTYDRIPGRMALALRLAVPRLRRQLPACPGPVYVIMRSLFAQPWLDAPPSGPEDLILKPPRFSGSSFLDWSRHAEVVEESYRWARTTLDSLADSGDPALGAVEAAMTGTS